MCKKLVVLGLSSLLVLSTGQAAVADAFWGGVLGASLGGFVGSTIGKGDGRLVATGLGVATGAVVGSAIGASTSRRSSYAGAYDYGYDYVERPTYRRVYQPTYVAPPEMPTRVVYVNQPVVVTGGYVGGYAPVECRPYEQTTQIGNVVRRARGTACLQPDGTWQVQ